MANLPPKQKMFVEYFLGGSCLLINDVFLTVHVQSPSIEHSERRLNNDISRLTWLEGTFSVVTRGQTVPRTRGDAYSVPFSSYVL